MGFVSVCRAIYDYAPQAEGELAIKDGDLLFILDKQGGDGWWKAKKKAGIDDDDEEPEGLVPMNYVEDAHVTGRARALYEYTRQTDEELSFPEESVLSIYDMSDADWILAGLDDEFGFVPANYIDMTDDGADDDDDDDPLGPSTPPPSLPQRPRAASQPDSPQAAITPPPAGPAAALAGVMAGRSVQSPATAEPDDDTTPPPQPPRQPVRFQEPRASDDEPVRSPALPSRPRPASTDDYGRPIIRDENTSDSYRTPGGFHMYNINEMVSVIGKRKKMPTTLGINLVTGIILIAPERASDGPSQEWTADKMTHYSREGKHVFLELVRPSKSVDFHAGAKDTAEEIVSALGEMAGAVRAEGLREVIAAGTGKSQRKGVSLYDFMAQGEDEVTVAAGDEVIILDDSKSEEWWQVRRLRNGKEGVVPSSYIEITGTMTPPPESSVRSTVESNRQEEIRLTKEALRASKEPDKVGPGMHLPDRGSSLPSRDKGSNAGKQRRSRENGRADGGSSGSKSKSKPDPSRVRTWSDRSKSFSVEAQFLGLKDGKIHLHKMNGVKIAVPITKMSHEDLEYVESMTGISLDDERPLADMKKSKASDKKEMQAGASVEKSKKPEYDWFQFFLNCDVAVGLCERYAQTFTRDSMDESVLPDVDASVLRNLGMREGDIIKVMRFLDGKFGRKKNAEPESEGGLFSGPGGALRNNTRKGRPAPTVQTSDTVDAAAFASSKKESPSAKQAALASPRSASPAPSPQPPSKTERGGFDDDAWDVKPSKQQLRPAQSKPRSPEPVKDASPPPPQLAGSLQDLSLLTQPLQPTKTLPSPPAQPPKVDSAPVSVPLPPQPTGASPAFFSTVPSSLTGQHAQSSSFGSPQGPRSRPTPPATAGSAGLVPPPPARPLSAPLSAQQTGYAPPMNPQMTGVQGQPAAPGHSLQDLAQARLQQQYTAQMQQPMMTGYQGVPGYATGQPQQSFMTQPMQPMMTGVPQQSPFADPRNQFSPPLQPQQTGYQSQFPPPHQSFGGQPPQGPVNNYLPPALEPQRTGVPNIQPQQTSFGQVPQQQQQQQPPAPQPLVPQKTGPPPPVRFGVQPEAKKLAPQPTGRRANLSQATPSNPFGF